MIVKGSIIGFGMTADTNNSKIAAIIIHNHAVHGWSPCSMPKYCLPSIHLVPVARNFFSDSRELYKTWLAQHSTAFMLNCIMLCRNSNKLL